MGKYHYTTGLWFGYSRSSYKYYKVLLFGGNQSSQTGDNPYCNTFPYKVSECDQVLEIKVTQIFQKDAQKITKIVCLKIEILQKSPKK